MPTRKYSAGFRDIATMEWKMVNKNMISINGRLIRAPLKKMVNEINFNQGLEFKQICFSFFDTEDKI